MTLDYRKERIKNLSDTWGGQLENDLIMTWKIPNDLFINFQNAIGLYISKAMHFNFSSDSEQIINLINKNRNDKTNVTPNGGVVPKLEYQLEFNFLLKSWCEIISTMIKPDPKLLSLFRITPNIRIKFGEETEENKNRSLNTAIPHSDAWVEGPFGLNCHVPIFGDLEKNYLQFYKLKDESKFNEDFLNTASTYNKMSWVLDYYEIDETIIPQKNYIYISDYALVHRTYRERNSGTRVSIDTTINSGDHKVHPDRLSEYCKLVPRIGFDLFVKVNRSENSEIIDKPSIYSHYTSGNLTQIKL